MRYRVIWLIGVTLTSLVLIYFQNQTKQLANRYEQQIYSSPPIELPYKWVGNIFQLQGNEPSGITYHPLRKTLFIVSDEGNLYELRTDGSLIREKFIEQADLEGITVNPITGFLYAAVEGEDAIIEIDPSSFKLTRKFPIKRNFEGRELLKKGGMGLEAIAFISDPFHPEGGVFWIGNQSFSLKPKREPSVVCEVAIPLNSTGMKEEGEIIGFFPLKIIDISGLDYDAARQCLIVISDTTNLLVEINLDGNVLHQYLLPGSDQEGIALDGMGFAYIAQENGKIIKIEDLRN